MHIDTVMTEKAAKRSEMDIIKEVAERKNIKEEHLLAIAQQESAMGKFLIGDNGCSQGWFQINVCANPRTQEIIGDFEKEAEWVADLLINYGYCEGYITLSLARYNNPSFPNHRYAEQVKINAERLKGEGQI